MVENALTIAQLQQTIKRGLESVLAPSYWVVAEVGGVNFAANGHCYLELVERDPNSSYTKAKISAALWRYRGSAIEYKFNSTTSSVLNVGMKILVCARVSYHELYGLSLVIVDIEPSFTLGEAERIKRETIERLEKEGLLALNAKIPIPSPISRIAVISSSKAAGYGDFCNELFGNSYGFTYHVELFESVVQGAAAEDSIIGSLYSIYHKADDFDIIVIIRGGGSNDDLSCFNSYLLCATIANSPLLVITGIGHERDNSIADMVAAVSVKTPTAVARYIIDSTLECETTLLELSDYFLSTLKEQLAYNRKSLEQVQLQLRSSVMQSVSRSSSLLFKLEQLVSRNSQRVLHEALLSVEQLSNDLAVKCKGVIISSSYSLNNYSGQIRTNAYSRIDEKKSSINLLSMELNSFDPKRIVEMGYAIAKLNGKLLRSGKELNLGDKIDISLADSTINAEVKEVKNNS